MGRKFEYKPGKFCWNLDRCEELVLMCAYDDIARFVPPEQQFGWRKEFEDLFYEKGRGVAFHIVDSINQVRKRKALPLIRFDETDISGWGRERDHDIKAERRRALRDELHALTPTARAKTVEDAWDEVRELPPPHRTFDEFRERQSQNDSENEASRREVARRYAAAAATAKPEPSLRKAAFNGLNGLNGHAVTPPPAEPQPKPVQELEPEPLPTPPTVCQEPPSSATHTDKLKRMLALAPSLASQIIGHLGSDDALDLAEHCDGEMRETLVLHALTALTGGGDVPGAQPVAPTPAPAEPRNPPPQFRLLSRNEAILADKTRYYTGRPCIHGHYSERYVRSDTCCECQKEYNLKHKQAPKTAANRHAGMNGRQ